MCESSMMPTLTWFVGSGLFMALISGSITRLSRSACCGSTARVLGPCWGDGGCGCRDDGDAEPPPSETRPAHPVSSVASAAAPTVPVNRWIRPDMHVLPDGSKVTASSRGHPQHRLAAQGDRGQAGRRVVAEEVDVIVDPARMVGLVERGRRRDGGGPRVQMRHATLPLARSVDAFTNRFVH